VTAPAKPKVVHVYRGEGPNPLWVDQHTSEPYAHPSMRLCLGEYLGEYVPRGPIVSERWEVRSPHLSPLTFVSHDDARGHAKYQRCSGLSACIVHIVTRKKAK